MKNILLGILSLLVLPLTGLRAADAANDKLIAAVRAADDERVAAIMAGDRARLTAIFSDGLHYAHSSGKIDTKASYTETLVTHATVYDTYDYITRDFVPAAPGIVLMIGHVLIHSHSGAEKADNDLNYLAVWREENGKWRFLAWQSCKNPPPTPAAK
jgi:ketosteroid isomerase-like protein